MIQELLNRDFVLKQLEDVSQHMENEAARRSVAPRRDRDVGAPPGAEELAPADFTAAAGMARQALASEARSSSGQAEDEPLAAAADRSLAAATGEAPPSIDERSFVSHDPVISVFQSVLEEYLETREPALIAAGEPDAAAGARAGDGDGAPPVTSRRLLRRERLFEQFSVTDPGWVSQLFAQALTRLRGRVDFNPEPAAPRQLQDRTRLLLVSDWGSGIERAQKVTDQMRIHLDQGKRDGVEQSAFHLGDIYYAGRRREIRKRVLPFWPVRADEADDVASYSLNGNHDMYSGGHAYYGTLLGDPRFAAQEQSSFFSLSNRHWRILGLDTAYKDKDFQEPQPEWIREQARQAARAGQKLCFLSHHQLFTVYASRDADLLATLDSIGSPHVDLWFWGHEHRLMTFKPHQNVRYARCIGHGGIPVYMKHEEDDPYEAPGEWEYRDFILDPNGKERWAIFGFAILELDGPEARVRYVNENGDEHRTETLAF